MLSLFKIGVYQVSNIRAVSDDTWIVVDTRLLPVFRLQKKLGISDSELAVGTSSFYPSQHDMDIQGQIGCQLKAKDQFLTVASEAILGGWSNVAECYWRLAKSEGWEASVVKRLKDRVDQRQGMDPTMLKEEIRYCFYSQFFLPGR